MDALVLDIAVRILSGRGMALLIWGGWLSIRPQVGKNAG